VDDGCGMDAEDARACFENHATSKITSIEDLSSISTYGFRGEALASIMAVSKVKLQTKLASQTLGTLVVASQNDLEVSSGVFNTGTDITVHDIFFNVPARRKFLKKEDAEWRAIVQIFQSLCISYTQVNFQLFSNNSLIYNCPAVSSLKNRVIQILDERFSQDLLHLEEKQAEGNISGIISNCHVGRYNKNHIFFLINRRCIKNYSLVNALLKGYGNSLPTGRYPMGVISLTIDPLLVDINVDPRKEEVRFVHPRKIETLISQTVTKTLENLVKKSVTNSAGVDSLLSFEKNNDTARKFSFFIPSFSADTKERESLFNTLPIADSTFPKEFKAPNSLESGQEKQETLPFLSETFADPQASNQQMTLGEKKEAPSATLLGIFHNTYLLVQQNDGLVIIDQHAAHERILFERFAHRFTLSETMALVAPLVISINSEQKKRFELLQILLQEYGIEIELAGLQELVVKTTPIYAKKINYQELIPYLLDYMQEHEQLEEHALKEMLHFALQAQMACKAAIKAGDILHHQEAEKLLKDLYTTSNSFSCPHGRPTMWKITSNELERKFKRKN